MSGPARILEVRARVDDRGEIHVDAAGRRLLQGLEGRVIVRIMRAGLNPVLKRLGVTEEEIARIASAQREDPEQVVSFLLSEGSLAGGGFERRWRRGAGALRS